MRALCVSFMFKVWIHAVYYGPVDECSQDRERQVERARSVEAMWTRTEVKRNDSNWSSGGNENVCHSPSHVERLSGPAGGLASANGHTSAKQAGEMDGGECVCKGWYQRGRTVVFPALILQPSPHLPLLVLSYISRDPSSLGVLLQLLLEREEEKKKKKKKKGKGVNVLLHACVRDGLTVEYKTFRDSAFTCQDV
uniref:Uncharacterized protein n=1 Tax=Knipowitschia caucasica TaxID=637954 RepID=A0AAV2LK17_KNICA